MASVLKCLKGSFLAGPGLLWDGPCHHLLIILWGMSVLANPTQTSQHSAALLPLRPPPPQLCVCV